VYRRRNFYGAVKNRAKMRPFSVRPTRRMFGRSQRFLFLLRLSAQKAGRRGGERRKVADGGGGVGRRVTFRASEERQHHLKARGRGDVEG